MLSLSRLSLLLILSSAETDPAADVPDAVAADAEVEEEVVDIFATKEAVRLTDDNYEALTHFETLTTDDWFVKFYAPWCGHCRNLAPVWEEVALSLKGKMNVGKLDVTTDERVGRGMNITRLPTLMLFRQGRTYVYPRRGTRTAEAMVEWALSDDPVEAPKEQPKPPAPKEPEPEEPTGPTDVVKLDTSNWDTMTKFTAEEEEDTGAWFIKFYAPWCGHCKQLAPTWEEVATELKGKVNVAKVDVTTNKELGTQFDIKSFPTLLFFKDGKMAQYDGQREKDALCEYATTSSPTEAIPDGEVETDPSVVPEDAVDDAAESDVVTLGATNFEVVTKFGSGEDTGYWFIEFYAPWCGHCKKLAPTWEEVATELKGKVNVAKVDVTENQAVGTQFGVKGFPTLLLFKDGKMEKYKGARTKEALCEYATTHSPSEPNPAAPAIASMGIASDSEGGGSEEEEEVATSDVVTLEEANFEQLTHLNSGEAEGVWFVKFYAPWCGHCKQLAPTWEEVATELKGKVNVAKVDVTENRELGQQYGVKGFPTLLLFKDGKMEKYGGDRSKDALCEWATTATPQEDAPMAEQEKKEL